MSSNRRDFLKGSVAATALGGLGAVADQGRAADLPGKEVLFQRRVTVRHEVDVFVAGGGPSGVAALLIVSNQTRAAEMPAELTRPNYRQFSKG